MPDLPEQLGCILAERRGIEYIGLVPKGYFACYLSAIHRLRSMLVRYLPEIVATMPPEWQTKWRAEQEALRQKRESTRNDPLAFLTSPEDSAAEFAQRMLGRRPETAQSRELVKREDLPGLFDVLSQVVADLRSAVKLGAPAAHVGNVLAQLDVLYSWILASLYIALALQCGQHNLPNVVVTQDLPLEKIRNRLAGADHVVARESLAKDLADAGVRVNLTTWSKRLATLTKTGQEVKGDSRWQWVSSHYRIEGLADIADEALRLNKDPRLRNTFEFLTRSP